jgi:hypothetical protein
VAGYAVVSYAREDLPYVERMVAHFRENDIDVFFDRNIHYGEDWYKVVFDAIQHCSALVVVETPHSKPSTWVGKEIKHARKYRRRVLPVSIDRVRLWRIRRLQRDVVSVDTMPTAGFIKDLQELCANPAAQPMERAFRFDPDLPLRALPPQDGSHLTWLPYVLGDGKAHHFLITDGVVRSITEDDTHPEPWTRPWFSLGESASRMVATQDGSYLVVQSESGLRVAEVDGGGRAIPVASIGVDPGLRLVAARRSGADPAVEVLLSTQESAEIWTVRGEWREQQRSLPAAINAGAGTDDGFLVVGPDTTARLIAPDGAVKADLGRGWVDFDAGSSPAEITFAALRYFGSSPALCTAPAVKDLIGSPQPTSKDMGGVRVVRRLGDSFGPLAASYPVTHAGRPTTTVPELPG